MTQTISFRVPGYSASGLRDGFDTFLYGHRNAGVRLADSPDSFLLSMDAATMALVIPSSTAVIITVIRGAVTVICKLIDARAAAESRQASAASARTVRLYLHSGDVLDCGIDDLGSVLDEIPHVQNIYQVVVRE